MTIAVVSAGSALIGAAVGAAASLFSVKQQFVREDKMEREKRAANIITSVEDCGFALITAIAQQIVGSQEGIMGESIGKRIDPIQSDIEYKALLKSVREKGENAQRDLNKQKALARLFINAETRNKIDYYSQMLLQITKELIENHHREPLSLATAKDMPSKARFDQALLNIYAALEQYVEGSKKSCRCCNRNI